MLRFAAPDASRRKCKLFCVACCLRLGSLLPADSLEMLLAVEQSADSELSPDEATALSDDAMAYADGLSWHMGTPIGCADWLAATAVWDASEGSVWEASRA